MKKLLALINVMLFPVMMMAQSPMDPVIALFNDGAAKINAGDFKTAIADFEEVIPRAEEVSNASSDPKVKSTANDLITKSKAQLPVLYYQVATAQIKANKYEDALPNLIKTVELSDLYGNNADNKAKALKYLPQLYKSVGDQKLKGKNYSAAHENYDNALRYDPDYTRAILGKGMVFAEQMKEKDMVQYLTRAIELAKQAADEKTVETATLRLGKYFVNRGNIDLADIDPEEPDYSLAIESFEKAISYNPAAADAYYMLAVIWNKNIEFDKAIENSKKALEFETDATKIGAINLELGNGYFGIAEYSLACEAYNKAMVGPIAEKAVAKKEKVPGCE